MSPKLETQSCDIKQLNYTLDFKSILNSQGSVDFFDYDKKIKKNIGITIKDRELNYRFYSNFPSVVADLIDLAVAIYASDRLSYQPLRETQSQIYVTLPVRNPQLFNSALLQEKLNNLLDWATGSRWHFDFQQRTESERIVEQQQVLPMIENDCEVALWSGGLDSLAGVYTKLNNQPKLPFMLFGTGSNKIIHNKQKKVCQAVNDLFPSRVNICQVQIDLNNSNKHRKNKISRSRGIVFTLLGSACAYLMGQKTLHIYENGIGAINLPYRASAVGLEHSRSVHPITLLMVSDLISEILGETFRVKNPFLFWTKAEMCQRLAKDQRTELSALTMSCDSPHRRQGQPMQCGYCSSCILRKQALAASGLEDKTSYVIPHGNKPKADPRLHLQNMLVQVKTLDRVFGVSDRLDIQWENLTQRFPELDDIVDRVAPEENFLYSDMRSSLLQLYRNYVTEWHSVESQVAADILKWNNQHLSDKSFVFA